MIRNNVKELIDKLAFPQTSKNELLYTLDLLLSNNSFVDIISRYNDVDYDFDKMLSDTKILAEEYEICHYTAHMVLLLCLVPELYKKYKAKGIADKIFFDTIMDLRYKLDECQLVHGKVGTFVANWYKGFFNMSIFALGRLQFEIKNTWFDCDVNGIHIPKDTKVLGVHIPRTGTRLDHNLVVESYSTAKEFFKSEFDGKIYFVCNSWLLYPWNRTILKDDSNLAMFYDDFCVVSSGEYSNYNECWRLFDCLYNDDPDSLPNDTSLRKAYIERIKSGLPIGHGTGVIVFDK